MAGRRPLRKKRWPVSTCRFPWRGSFGSDDACRRV